MEGEGENKKSSFEVLKKVGEEEYMCNNWARRVKQFFSPLLLKEIKDIQIRYNFLVENFYLYRRDIRRSIVRKKYESRAITSAIIQIIDNPVNSTIFYSTDLSCRSFAKLCDKNLVDKLKIIGKSESIRD